MIARLTLAFALAASIVAAAPRAAHAQGGAAAEAERYLDEGRRLYRELDFSGAVEALRRALAVPGAPASVRIQAFEYLGSSYVVLENESEAREAFREMMEIDPYHVVREPSGSPKIARFVAAVRREMAPDAALDPDNELEADLPRAGRVGRATRVRFRVRGPAGVTRIEVHYRGVGEREWSSIESDDPSDGEFELEIPERSSADELELYADARDERNRLVARAGEPLFPLNLPIRASGATNGGGTNVLEQWWFWATVAGIAAGAFAVGLILASPEQAPAGTLPPGRVELP